ncbi:MAG: hypothetical protein J0L61_00565 [Planctomycetes bacterium]|nr:hypothetical protein [Planctomycetota bacterium]
MSTTTVSVAAGALLSIGAAASAGIPAYNIVEIGVLAGDSFSQGFRGSSDGRYATGRSLPPSGSSRAYIFDTTTLTMSALPNLASPVRNFGVGNAVNNSGVVVGTGATTAFGSSPLPLIWNGGVVSQLPLPAGQTIGRANDVNNNNVAVGSVNGGSLEAAVVYSGGSAQLITANGPGGTFMRTAFGVNDAGLVAGNGVDPNNAARNVGLVYNISSNTMVEVGALPGANGALAFDISPAGHVAGSSMLNQGSGLPFVWTSSSGMTAIPLPVGTSQGSARGVNSDGWAVGTASSAFAIPFLYDGSQTYRLADLIDPSTGWDLSTNTSSSALSISDNGVIIGTGVRNGVVKAYAMIPVPTPGAGALLGGLGVVAARRRR